MATTAVEYLQSIAKVAVELQSDFPSFLSNFMTDLQEIDDLLYSIQSTPHCDDCGAIDEAVEWCGGCGCCVEHCQLTDLCDDYATEILELRQNGD